MKKFTKHLLVLAGTSLSLSMVAQNVDYTKYPDYSAVTKADPTLRARRVPGRRPDHVNNGESRCFPPVINQDGGSCGSASRIYYMFTYEINAYRNADGSKPENQYPTHFTWLLTNSNSGKEGMARANGVPNSVTYGGNTYSRLFGNQDCGSNDFGWMQGYDKWFEAMHNRISRSANFPLSVETEEGREAVKNWIWNHNGDPDFQGRGGICGIGVASAGDWKNIPSTPTNNSIGVTGKKFVNSWGKTVDHALTIVGYDDRIEFDLDGNGVYGEKSKDEVGAWIIVNSWSPYWCNKGFIYCPYKYAVPVGKSGGYYKPEIYYVRKNYRPLKTFKIRMAYSKRSELSLKAGIAADTSATAPEQIIQMEHFNFAGDGDGNGKDAETPMLGRWADGNLHKEPMEFGYDITDLSAVLDPSKPAKYFFVIDSKNTADGVGKVEAVSLMDYTHGEPVIEIPFPIGSGVDVKTHGERTIISFTVPGEYIAAPRNVLYANGQLTWDEPGMCTYNLTNYKVYKNGQLLSTVGKNVHAVPATEAATYAVEAVYDNDGVAMVSSRVAATSTEYHGATPSADFTRKFYGAGFRIKDLFKQKYEQATIEYWIKPIAITDNSQKVGPGWGDFLIHFNTQGQAIFGWDNSSPGVTRRSSVLPNVWKHVAIVINGSKATAYINGVKQAETVGSKSGIGGFGDFIVGRDGNDGIRGEINEFRVWSTARSQTQIQQHMYTQIANPENEPGLLAELTMDEPASETIGDKAQHHVVEYLGRAPQRLLNTSCKDKRTIKAAFSFPESTVYSNTAIQLVNESAGNAVKFQWTVKDGSNTKVYTTPEPSVIFQSPGQKKVTLRVEDINGNADSISKDVTAVSLALPKANFMCPKETYINMPVTFVNLSSPLEGVKYTWTANGADKATSNTQHLKTAFTVPGTYEVKLTVANGAGSTECSHTILVKNLEPIVNFEVDKGAVRRNTYVKFTDRTEHEPTQWYWEISSADTVIVHEGQLHGFRFVEPGRYDIRLDAGNDCGWGTYTLRNAVVVSNEDPKTGLNFKGAASEYVTFDNPLPTTGNNDMTIDYWLNAQPVSTYNNQVGDQKFYTRTLNNGSVLLTIGDKHFTSSAHFYRVGEWHHYAFVFSGEYCNLYRDCQLIEQIKIGNVNLRQNLPAKFRLGSAEAPMKGILDEFRVWNSALSQKELLALSNRTIKNVAAEQAAHKLVLYYQFNQSGGDVIDATSGAHKGTRVGFGPDGDAWSNSLGVFSLSKNGVQEVTEKYLTNYKRPFLYTSNIINPAYGSRFAGLEMGTQRSGWKQDNVATVGNVKMSFFVDRQKNDLLALMTGALAFADSAKNLKLYQTITLPAGYYTFGMIPHDFTGINGSYLVVNKGEGLPDAKQLQSAIASAELKNMEVNFRLTEETEISLGLLCNTGGYTLFNVDRFYLNRKGTNDKWIYTSVDTPEILPADNVPSTIYDLQGRKVEKTQSGLYIINGKKILVK